MKELVASKASARATCVVSRDGLITEATGALVDAVGRRLAEVLPWVDAARRLGAMGVIGAEIVQHEGSEAEIQLFDGGAANVTLRRVSEPSCVHCRDADETKGALAELGGILAKLPIAILISQEQHVVTANRAMARLLGRSAPSELVGCGIGDILAPDEIESATDSRDRFLRGERVEPRSWRALRSDGTSVFVEGVGVREVLYGGAPAVLWALRDVTELRRAQAQLLQADRLASIGALAAGVAHEINNPLSFVCASIDYVDEVHGRLTPQIPPAERVELAELMAELRTGTERVRKVVAELKVLSRADAESLVPLELDGIVDLAIRMTSTETRHRARLVREYGPAPRVRADATRLGQVFLNLLVNASQALPEGRASENEIRVSIGTTADGWASIEVYDTGPGIAPDAIDRIFDPFFTTKPAGVGTGLGLAICRTTIERLGGSIRAANGKTGGASFRIVLPPCDDPIPLPTSAESTSSPSIRRHRILVVDDDVAVGRAVTRALARDHHVEFISDPRRALSVLENGEPFDLVLCDVMMPALNGPQLHERVLGTLGTNAPPFVFLTGGAFTPGAARYVAATSDALIEKPFDVDALRRFVTARLAR